MGLRRLSFFFLFAFVTEALYCQPLSILTPTRDGVRLAADVYLPVATPAPTLLYRTPYGRKEEAATYGYFRRLTDAGYVVVVQDVRGRYDSEGEFVPYENEGKDGYDTIEWLSQQPWSNGRIGTFGLSYPGAVQWLAAVESPPDLVAMVPAMTFSRLQRILYPNHLFDLGWLPWVWNYIAPDLRRRKNLPGPKTVAEAEAQWETQKEALLARLPLTDQPDVARTAPFYVDWLKEGPLSKRWHYGDLTRRHRRVRAAVLNLSGWHDEAYGANGAIENFLGVRRARGKGFPNHLLLGPWIHGVRGTGATAAGDRDFGPTAAIDYDGLLVAWFDRHLKKNPPKDSTAPVRYFVMGLNQWREAPTWPPPGHALRTLYLSRTDSPKGHLTLRPQAASLSFSSYISDPNRPVLDSPETTYGAYDLSALSLREDVLTFESPPLTGDWEVTGFLEFEIYASSSAPNFDLFARLLDVAPDGKAFNLMSPAKEVERASYQSGKRQNPAPGQIVRFRFRTPVTSNLFRKDHRIRLCLHSTYFPTLARNPQSGQSDAVATRLQAHRVHIHHSRHAPSRLRLPVREQ